MLVNVQRVMIMLIVMVLQGVQAIGTEGALKNVTPIFL